MRSIRSRPVCRAHNTFSPATALWQHFVAPGLHLPRRLPKSSLATESAQSSNDNTVSTEETAAAFDPARLRKVADVSMNVFNTTDHKQYHNVKQQDVKKLLIEARDAYDLMQGYKGEVILPLFVGGVRAERQLPWSMRSNHNLTAVERLNLEMNKFHEYIQPTHAESVARKHIIEQVRGHVRQILPGYVLEVFGSERTGLSFALSDIDLRLVPQDRYSDSTQAVLPPTWEQRYTLRGDLAKLSRRLTSDCRAAYSLPTLRWARYPLISLQDLASRLSIQIVLSNDSALSRQIMQRYMEEYPYLAHVYSVIKAALDIRGLSDVFQGGVGSYPLFMMIVASLKHDPSPRDDAAGALLNFLRFWGSFKTDEHGLSIEPPEYLSKSTPIASDTALKKIKKGKVDPLPPWILNLRDPADETNDLGRRIVAWKHVKTTFSSLFKLLSKDLKEDTRPSLLARFILPVHPLQKTHRKRLHEYGQSLSKAGKHYTSGDAVELSVEGADAGAAIVGLKASVAAPFIKKVVVDRRRSETYNSPNSATAPFIRKVYIEGQPNAEVSSEASEDAEKQTLADAEALGLAKKAAQIDDAHGVNTWLTGIEEASEHKETGQAFSDIFGLNKKTNK